MLIKDMLNEELGNSLRIKRDYEQALSELPRGALVRKIIRGREYFYLASREGGKVKFKYVGKLDKREVAKHQEAKKLRARYRKKISEVGQQVRFIRKVLRGKCSV